MLRLPRPAMAAALALLAAAPAAADTSVLVLRDGLRSEYGFCREDERGGWGKRHPALPLFRAGVLGYAHRFQQYLKDSPQLAVYSLDLEAHWGEELPLTGVRVVILDDVRAEVVAPWAARLLDFVERGGSLIVVGGFHGFGGQAPHERFSMTKRASDYRATLLDNALPVEVAESPDYATTRRPKIAFADSSPLGVGLEPGAWPLYGYHRTRPRATARVLATIDEQPLVAVHAVGRGLVVAFTGSELETAFANWKADPWPDEAVFWQRVVALALSVLDVKVELRALPLLGPRPLVQAVVTNVGEERRTLRLDAWLEGAGGERWELARQERLRVSPDQPVVWPVELSLADVPPGVCRVVVHAADARRAGALYADAASLTIPRPLEDQLKVSLSVPETVRRGRVLRGELEVRAKGEAPPLRLRLLKGRRELATLDVKAGASSFEVATAALRPGAYSLELAAERTLLSRRFYVAEYDPHFQNLLWWGQGDFADGSVLRRRMVEDLLAHRVGAGAPTDLCERHGIWTMQSTGGIGALSRFAKASEKPESQWMDASGKRRGTLCFNDPLFAEALPRWAEGLAAKYGQLHSLGILHIEDEAGCPDCYCEDCQRLFREQYGHEMPRPQHGLAPSADLLDRWIERMDFKQATFARYHKAVHDEFKKHLPQATVLTSLPQGFTIAHGETVIDHQRHLDAFWEHTYPGTEPLGAALAAHRVEMAAAAIGAPERPFIHLLQGFDEVSRVPKMPPREYVRLISWMALAHGADHLGWFVYRWMWWHMPGTEAWEAAGEMGRLLDRLAPTLAELGPVHHPIALLYPLSQECVDHLRTQTASDAELPQRGVWTWRVWHSYEDAYFALRFAGVPFEPLYEQSAMAGKLRYKAIVIPHADTLRKEVVAALRQFLDGGGAVLLGASSTLDLPGATKLPMGFLTLFNTYFPAGRRQDWQKGRIRCCWIEPVLEKARALKATLAPFHDAPVTVSEPEVVWSLRDGGDVKYLFLLNDKTTNPITEAQREMRGKYAHFVIMPMTYHPVRARVTVRAAGPVYDVLAGERVAWADRDGQASFEADLEGGGAKVYAIPRERVRSLRIASRQSLVLGEPLPIHVSVWGRRELLRGVVAVKITLEVGGAVRTLYAATREGECQAELPTDIELPPGTARLRATELISGESATRRVKLLPAPPLLTPES